MKFQAYASSSAGNLYSVDDGRGALLLECGLAIGDIRRLTGFNLSRVAACLVSHHHGDHARSHSELARLGVDVYASVETWRALRASEGHCRRFYARPRVAFAIGEWRVLPFDVRHDADGALGFLVEDHLGDRLLYACDTAFIPYRFAKLTHVAVECNYSRETLRRSSAKPRRIARVIRYHMSLERVVTMLETNDLSRVKEIWLLHLSDQHGDASEFRRVIRRATGKPVYVAPKFLDRRGGDTS
jgi:phosphoribosyl 1,2-cyclic phosphodiesterase